jgi:hypothetical protein
VCGPVINAVLLVANDALTVREDDVDTAKNVAEDG